MEGMPPNFSSSLSPSRLIVKVSSDDVENNSKVKMTSKDEEKIFKSKSSSRLDRPEEQDLVSISPIILRANFVLV